MALAWELFSYWFRHITRSCARRFLLDLKAQGTHRSQQSHYCSYPSQQTKHSPGTWLRTPSEPLLSYSWVTAELQLRSWLTSLFVKPKMPNFRAQVLNSSTSAPTYIMFRLSIFSLAAVLAHLVEHPGQHTRRKFSGPLEPFRAKALCLNFALISLKVSLKSKDSFENCWIQWAWLSANLTNEPIIQWSGTVSPSYNDKC